MMCDVDTCKDLLASADDTGDDSVFVGHYVVLCGVDVAEGVVHFADPASRAPMDAMPVSVFEEARHSFGTDDDVILVPPLP